MPQLTGLDLSKAIYGIRPDIPIILCTGYGDAIALQSVPPRCKNNPYKPRFGQPAPTFPSNAYVTNMRWTRVSKTKEFLKNIIGLGPIIPGGYLEQALAYL